MAVETENFTYDFLDRLTGVSGAYSETYDYADAEGGKIGNLTAKGGVAYDYDLANKPHAVRSVGSTIYNYDLNGNMLVGTARTWDVENRLTSITKDAVTTDFDQESFQITWGITKTGRIVHYAAKRE